MPESAAPAPVAAVGNAQGGKHGLDGYSLEGFESVADASSAIASADDTPAPSLPAARTSANNNNKKDDDDAENECEEIPETGNEESLGEVEED